MKVRKFTNWIGLIWAAVVLLGSAGIAAAAGTSADTDITNTATVNYEVNSIGQDEVTATATFKVDNRVDLTISSAGNVDVTPGGTGFVMSFTLENTGNMTQGYSLSVVNGTTEIPMIPASISIYYDADGDGSPNAGELYTIGENVTDVDPDNTITILVVADAPSATNGAVDGDEDMYHLVATTLNAGTTDATAVTSGANAVNGLDVVLADGSGSESSDADHDGTYSASGTYTVKSAKLDVQKSSEVIEDLVNGTTNPKAIPGATVKYTITVINNGSVAADSVAISDTIPANCNYVEDSMTIVGGSDLTDISGDDEGECDGTDMTVTYPSIASGATKTLEFKVTID